MAKPKTNIKDSIKELEKQELQLFHSYNRHNNEDWKLNHLKSLIEVIDKLNNLKKQL